ncbi:WD40-repeat-containing domain protein [Gloeopeniophorella convolvens]|nr:WD40-repeat-containing domain protein [Gloeopeniophorella convolvens]
MSSDLRSPQLAIQYTLRTPAHVSALFYTHNGALIVGSDDGSLRFYQPPATKVVKAIRGLGSEVSSVAGLRSSLGDCCVWVACGTSVTLFDLGAYPLIQTAENALKSIKVGEDDSDLVNEASISLSENQKNLSFTTDNGTVGTVDLTTSAVQRMRVHHSSICATVRFIPDRPGEVVSGGYDSTLMHFDWRQGSILSRRQFSSPPPTSEVSLSPPFVLCLAVSITGAVAAGTADGQLWVGLGGDKRVSIKKSRKWEGLREEMGLSCKVADGPIVTLAFLNPETIVTSSLLGVVSLHSVHIRGTASNWKVESTALGQTEIIAKVNAIAIHGNSISIGGLTTDGKGIVEVYRLDFV